MLGEITLLALIILAMIGIAVVALIVWRVRRSSGRGAASSSGRSGPAP